MNSTIKHALLFLAVAILPAGAAGWMEDFTMPEVTASAVGGWRQDQFGSGPSEWAAGVGLEAPFNPYLSGTVRLLSLEGPDRAWGGSAVDELAVGAKGKFLSSANRKFSMGGAAGIDRSFRESDFGFHLGLWGGWNPTKRLKLEIAEELTAWFKQNKQWLTLFSVGYTLGNSKS